MKLGLCGLSVQSYGGLLEAVVSYFKVAFRYLGGEAEETTSNIRIIGFVAEVLEEKFPNKKLIFFVLKYRLSSIKHLKPEFPIHLISRPLI